jgi:membrane protein DedA with SNARE-associated domain
MVRIVGEGELDRARIALSGAGGLALLLTRGVPVLAETMVLGAGAVKMPFGPFLAITGAANLAVALAYAAVGALALSNGSFFLFFLGLAVLPGIGWLAWTKARPCSAKLAFSPRCRPCQPWLTRRPRLRTANSWSPPRARPPRRTACLIR